MVRVGIIGQIGHVGDILDGIPLVPDAQLVAYGCANPGEDVANLQKHAAFTDQTRVFPVWQRMLREVNLDVVGVCLPFPQNGVGACVSMENGCHVMCEKPVATDWETFERLKQTHKSKGKTLSALFTMRYNPAWQCIHDSIAAGVIGQPLLAFAQKSYRWGWRPPFYKERKTYGGTIPWIAVHAIEAVSWVTGLDYTAVAGFHGTGSQPEFPECEDHVALTFEMTEGAMAVVTADFLRPAKAPSHGDDRLRVAGTEGVIEAFDGGQKVVLIRNDAEPRELPLPKPPQIFAEFLLSLRGKAAHRISTTEVLRITKVCLSARDAADNKQLLRL